MNKDLKDRHWKRGGDAPYGQWFVRGCRSVNRLFPPDTSRLERSEREKRKRFEREEERFRKISSEFNDALLAYKPSDKRFRTVEMKYRKGEKRFRRIERLHRQEKFRKAVYFLGLDMELHEVLRFSAFVALCSFLLLLVVFSFLLLIFSLPFWTFALYMIPSLFIIPIALFSFIASYPEILANRVKALSIGKSPETVNYLSMSMRLSPSLNRAVSFAAEHSEEPVRSGLKKILWDIYVKKHNTVEESFLAFAYEWGDWNDDFKRSLYTIRASTLERSDEGLGRSLDKANDIILSGTRRKIDKFASSLTAPTTVLFALGVLLPLIIGAMLPLLSMNLPLSPRAYAEQTSYQDNTPTIILMMDILFPFAALVYAYHILGKRPGTSTPPKVKSLLSKRRKQGILFFSVVILLLLSLLSLPFIRNYLGRLGEILLTLPIILGIGFSIGYYYVSTTSYQKKKRDEILKLEEEFPDALFQLGSRIAEGEPLERAFKKVSQSMRGTSVGELFERIAYNIRVTRLPLRDVLFGESGVLKGLQSRNITAAMEATVEAVEKEAVVAGTTIINLSSYLKDMKKVEHDIRVQLNNAVSMMKSTGILFAPLVLGITASLYVLISNSIGALTKSPMIPTDLFFLIIGVYLILMLLVIMYFCTGIEHGEDRIALRYNIGVAMPVAVTVYVLSAILGMIFVG